MWWVAGGTHAASCISASFPQSRPTFSPSKDPSNVRACLLALLSTPILQHKDAEEPMCPMTQDRCRLLFWCPDKLLVETDGRVLRIAGKKRNAQWLCKQLVPRAGFAPFPCPSLIPRGFIPVEVAKQGCHPWAASRRQGRCLAEPCTSASLMLPAKTLALAKNRVG